MTSGDRVVKFGEAVRYNPEGRGLIPGGPKSDSASKRNKYLQYFFRGRREGKGGHYGGLTKLIFFVVIVFKSERFKILENSGT